MHSLRQVFRCGTRLIPTKSTNLHRLPEETLGTNVYKRIQTRLKTDLCESLQEDNAEATNKKVLGKIQGKLKVMFTCKICYLRSSKIISKLAYEKGVIIIRCDGCKNNHLIADNLGWFAELKSKNNIEKLMAAKGETVRRLRSDEEGYLEVVEKAEFDLLQHNHKREEELINKQDKTDDQNKQIGTSEEMQDTLSKDK